jgi:AcrR family transcriptional regulator
LVVTSSHLRIDATRNRDAILEAARELFADSDDFAMCEIARRAGVGQATLYRNFPDRRALAAEILVGQLDRVAQCATDCAGDPIKLWVNWLRVTRASVLSSNKVGSALPS